MKRLNSIIVATTMIAAQGVHADVSLPSWLDVSGQINFDVNGQDSNDYDAKLRVQDAELRFEILAREGVKLVVRAELEKQIQKALDGDDQDKIDRAEIEKMIEEAYIEIETDKVSGLPRAIITAGKHRMAFAQRLTQLPMFKDSLLHKLTNEEEMVGLTVTLPGNFFNIVDKVAVSLYETGAGDFKISKEKGVSIQLSKALTKQLEMQVSGLMKEKAGSSDKETRASVGFVFAATEGLKIYAQGVVMDKNPEYQNSRYAAQIGAALKLGVGAIVVEVATIEKHAHELSAAYNMPVGANLVLSPEVRYTKFDNGTDDTTAGIRARLEFGKHNAKVNKGPRG